MAKDLPYFKFFVSEWNDGDINLENYKIQGLFINVCAYYWSRECQLDYNTLLKKFKHNVNEINLIIESNLIKLDGDKVYINFLDEQFEERALKSKINKINGSKGGRPKNRNKTQTITETKPNALNSLTETKGNKRREEKKREDKIIPTLEEFKSYALLQEPNLVIRDLEFKYKSWKANNWMDGNNKKVTNWKAKLLNTIPYLKVNSLDAVETPEEALARKRKEADRF